MLHNVGAGTDDEIAEKFNILGLKNREGSVAITRTLLEKCGTF
jgi:hypothetical protein